MALPGSSTFVHVPQSRARRDVRDVLVELLATRIERAFMTAGSARGNRVVRDVLGCINAGALSAAVHELGLEKELTRELARIDDE